MRYSAKKWLATGLFLAVSVGIACAQWTGYVDYARGAGTGARVLTIQTNKTGGWLCLTNQATGLALTNPATGRQMLLTMVIVGAPSGINTVEALAAGTPAYTEFNGFCDLSGYCAAYMDTAGETCSILITNLVVTNRYRLKATVNRNNAPYYNVRMTLVELLQATSSTPAHSAGVGTSGLAANQAEFQCYNAAGDYVCWTDISPSANGAIELRSSRFTNQTAYAMSAFKLESLSPGPANPVVIVSQPLDATVCPGGTANFSVGVTGAPPISYQWYSNNVRIANATASNLTVTVVAPVGTTNGYKVVVSNSFNSLTSRVAILTMSGSPVVINLQPTNTLAPAGGTATFAVGVTAGTSRPITNKWYKSTDGVVYNSIPGASQTNLTLSGLTPTSQGYYRATVQNCASTATSAVAQLTVYYNPIVITSGPDDTGVSLGQNATFTVTVSGQAPTYQWYRGNGIAIPWGTAATLSLTNVQYSDGDYYYVVVSNPAGAVTSGSALLTVSLPTYTTMPLTNWTWRYNQDALDLGTAWRAPDYDDSAWSSGPSVLGYENNTAIVPYINTVLNLTNNGRVNWTYYFRTTFNLTNDPHTVRIFTTNYYDDGAVVYLNGVEAYRWNLPAGTINYLTPANSGTLEPTTNFFTSMWATNLPASLLLPGANDLAVEVHQVNQTSGDVVMSLIAAVTFPPTTDLQVTNQPPNLLVEENSPAVFRVGYIGFPAYFQWYRRDTNGVGHPISWGVLETLTITNATLADQGYYYATISNVINQVTTSDAQLLVHADTNAPTLIGADGTTASNKIILTFSEPLFIDTNRPLISPTNAAQYLITNTVTGATLAISNVLFDTTRKTNVTLTTAVPQAGYNYIVTIGPPGVLDYPPRMNNARVLAAPVTTFVPAVNFTDDYDWYNDPLIIDQSSYYPNGIWGTNYVYMKPGFVPDQGGGWGGTASSPPAPSESPFCNEYHVSDAGLPIPPQTILSDIMPTPTVYFIKYFTVNASPLGVAFTLRHIVQDGAIFYINGFEVTRTNLPLTGVTPMTAATTDAAAVRSPYISVPLSLVSMGNNVLAAELHAYPAPVGGTKTTYFAAEVMAKVDSVVTGRVVITTQPANVIAVDGQAATFTFEGAGAYAFAWRTNNGAVPAPSGTSPILIIPRVNTNMNGMRVSVTITGAGVGNTATSSNAILTVVPDTTVPTLVSAFLTSSNQITVTFSESMSATSLTARANYRLTNSLGGPDLVINNITTANGGTNAILTLASVPPGNYVLIVNGQRDGTGNGNYITNNARATVGLAAYPLVDLGDTDFWKWNNQAIDLGTTWRDRAYDDSNTNVWVTGASAFDVWNGGARTVAGGQPVNTIWPLSQLAVPTTYLRKWIYVPVLGPGATMTISTLADDGCIYYMNGKLFYALGAATPSTFAAWATRTVGEPPGVTVEGPFNVPLTNMVVGSNILAGEAKQIAATSSDLTFGTWLNLNVPSTILPAGGPTNAVPPPYVPPAPKLSVAAVSPTQVRLSWVDPTNRPIFRVQIASNSLAIWPQTNRWLTISTSMSPYTVTVSNRPAFYRLYYPTNQ